MNDQEIIQWLLDGDPSIRWQGMRDLLMEDEQNVLRERDRIAAQGWGARLLSHQDASGRWSGQLYDHKWISTTYTLLLLRRMGLDQRNVQAHQGCKQLFEGGYQPGGGISFAKTVSHIDIGVVGIVLSILAYFNYQDDRVHEIAAYLLDRQLPDGSWNPVPESDRLQYIFAGTLIALEGLREYDQAYPHMAGNVSRAQRKGRDFLLGHELYKSKNSGQAMDDKITRFSFPPRWHYDVLAALDYLQACDSESDARLQDAVELLVNKRRKDGRWTLQNRHPGKTFFEMEEPGKPSLWNTLRALRVLKWWQKGGSTHSAE
jgi:hypothetical protein